MPMTEIQNPAPSGLPEYSFSTMDLMRDGFHLFAKAPGVFIAYLIIGWTLTFAGGYIPFLGPVIPFLLGVLHTAGLYVLLNKLHETGTVRIEDCMGAVDFFGQATLATIISTVFILLGCIFLLIPGIYLWTAYTLTIPFLLFDRLQAWDALERSRKIIGLNFFAVFWFVGIASLINLLGFLALGIGILVTVPTTSAATYLLYRLVKRSTMPHQQTTI